MAKFHALPIALRVTRPKVFEEKIKPYLQRINLYEGIDTDGEITKVCIPIVFTLLGKKRVSKKNIHLFASSCYKKSLCASVSKVQGLDEKLRQKIFKQLKNCSDWRNQNVLAEDSPYTGIAHCDLWTNNLMFTYGKSTLKCMLKCHRVVL